jgi:hypothetical protein
LAVLEEHADDGLAQGHEADGGGNRNVGDDAYGERKGFL